MGTLPVTRQGLPRRLGEAREHGSRPRVLIEEPDVARAVACFRLLGDSYEVSWCAGFEGPSPGRCPLVASGQCELVRRADVVVSSLDLHHEYSRSIVSALRHYYPRTPVVVPTPQCDIAPRLPLFPAQWGPWQFPYPNGRCSIRSSLPLPSPRRVHATVNVYGCGALRSDEKDPPRHKAGLTGILVTRGHPFTQASSWAMNAFRCVKR